MQDPQHPSLHGLTGLYYFITDLQLPQRLMLSKVLSLRVLGTFHRGWPLTTRNLTLVKGACDVHVISWKNKSNAFWRVTTTELPAFKIASLEILFHLEVWEAAISAAEHADVGMPSMRKLCLLMSETKENTGLEVEHNRLWHFLDRDSKACVFIFPKIPEDLVKMESVTPPRQGWDAHQGKPSAVDTSHPLEGVQSWHFWLSEHKLLLQLNNTFISACCLCVKVCQLHRELLWGRHAHMLESPLPLQCCSEGGWDPPSPSLSWWICRVLKAFEKYSWRNCSFHNWGSLGCPRQRVKMLPN